MKMFIPFKMLEMGSPIIAQMAFLSKMTVVIPMCM